MGLAVLRRGDGGGDAHRLAVFRSQAGEHGLDAAILRRVRGRARAGHCTLTAGLALGLMAAGPAWSHVSALVGAKGLARIAAPDVRGWRRAQTPMAAAWAPHFADVDQHFQARFADGRGHIVDLALIAYDRQTEGELIGFGQGAVDPAGGWEWTSPAWGAGEARGEIITAPGPVRRHVVSFYRVGVSGMTGSAARIKLDTMTARLLMRDQRAIAILVSAEDREGAPAEEAIRAFLKSLGHPAIAG